MHDDIDKKQRDIDNSHPDNDKNRPQTTICTSTAIKTALKR